LTWVLEGLAAAGLVKGETIGIDATTLEANGALRGIVGRDTGASVRVVATACLVVGQPYEHEIVSPHDSRARDIELRCCSR